MIMGALLKVLKRIQNLKRAKMVHEMTGKVVDVRIDTMMKASIAGLIDSQMNRGPKALAAIPSYGRSCTLGLTTVQYRKIEPTS